MIINQQSKKYTYIIYKYIYKSNKIKPLIFEISVCQFVIFFNVSIYILILLSTTWGVIASMFMFLNAISACKITLMFIFNVLYSIFDILNTH